MITRIEATYPATDGSAPERIEITWEDQTPPAGVLVVLVDALGRVPRRRYEVQLKQPDPAVVREAIRDGARRLRDGDPRADLATGGTITAPRWPSTHPGGDTT